MQPKRVVPTRTAIAALSKPPSPPRATQPTGPPTTWDNSGSAGAARDLHRQVLAGRQHDLGTEYPDTLTAGADLAYWTGQAGDPAAARDRFAALLPVRERVLGAEHPDLRRAQLPEPGRA